jgi:hypothetical protein
MLTATPAKDDIYLRARHPNNLTKVIDLVAYDLAHQPEAPQHLIESIRALCQRSQPHSI